MALIGEGCGEEMKPYLETVVHKIVAYASDPVRYLFICSKYRVLKSIV